MGIEIDYLPVGAGEKSGDAIAVRYGNLHGLRREQTVLVIDGGTKDSGQRLVDHIKSIYSTDTVDYVISTHPDGDHASGLTVVLEQMKVGLLVMHQPWNHAPEIRDLFRDGRITDQSLNIRIRTSLQAAHDLEQVALARKIRIIEPFTGLDSDDGTLLFLGPDREYYQWLIANFRGTPDPHPDVIEPGISSFRKAMDSVKEAVRWVAESMQIETLQDPKEDFVDGTSAENCSSTILLMRVDGQQILFTGDAGAPALKRAADTAEKLGIDLSRLTLLHVPHHGSKRNVGPTILNRIKAELAYISASEGGSPKHPSKKVINALKRRGNKVYATQGMCKSYSVNAPVRHGWEAAQELPFYERVEA